VIIRRERRIPLLRLLAILLLCVVPGEPYREEISETSTATVLVDISESMDGAVANRLLERARELTRGQTADVIPFAREAAPAGVGGGADFARLKSAWYRLDVGGTSLERALQGISGRRPGSILLISDGYETDGDARAAAGTLAGRGFRIFPLTEEETGERGRFVLSQLHAPLTAPTRKSVDIRASIRNATAVEQRGRLEINHDGKVVLTRQVRVAPGAEIAAVGESDPSKEGIREIVATLTPDDSREPPTSRTIYLSGQTREKVLLVSGLGEDSRFLEQALRDQSYQLTAVTAGERLASLPPLEGFSVVIFNNVAKQQLPAEAAGLVERYVRGGGAFLMLGGARGFGLGGWLKTPMEELLPVEILPPQTVKKRLNVAVALVLDKSRSMAFGERIEFAKEASREVIRNLKDDDFITVVGFDSVPFVVVKIGQLGQIRSEALDRVGRLFPANRTNMLPAIDEARRALVRANAGRKHMIILTDGRVPDAGPYYLELVKQMRLLGITVSTVLVGGEVEEMLREMANLGGGSFYQAADARALPRIFISDLKVSTGERSLKENEEYLVRAGPELESTKLTSYPPLRGYVQTKSRERASTELFAASEGKVEPLLASWSYGKGRSTAFTSDVSGRWSNYWVGWARFQTFWSDIIESLRPDGSGEETINFDLRYNYEGGALTFDLSIFSEKAAGAVSGEVVLPDGSTRTVSFAATSRGRYGASVADVIPGRYEVRLRAGARPLTPVAFYLSGELFGEQPGRGFNRPRLSELATITGGALNPGAEEVAGQVYTATERIYLGHWFLLVAAILLCLDILRREVWRTRTLGELVGRLTGLGRRIRRQSR